MPGFSRAFFIASGESLLSQAKHKKCMARVAARHSGYGCPKRRITESNPSNPTKQKAPAIAEAFFMRANEACFNEQSIEKSRASETRDWF
jgi:hypothetical protein